MSNPSIRCDDGEKYVLDTGYTWRYGNPTWDMDARGEYIPSNFVVIVRLRDCIVSRSAPIDLTRAPCLRGCIYVAPNKIFGPPRVWVPLRPLLRTYRRTVFVALPDKDDGRVYKRVMDAPELSRWEQDFLDRVQARRAQV